ncbi:unnamed protein product [Rotaria sordida]|uniref:Uncharacterized protein n=1 Tax=Rotaria sordida TaxID=392033 RepID=A0A815JSP0_9BILA|nr:unnamed protein product [Rotaria sordida]CAF1381837.1 unnamed protein product [Rotaria sordida]
MPDDHIELKNKATIGSKALKRVNGTLYKIGSAANLLCVSQIKYVYTIEFRPPDDMNDVHVNFAIMLPLTFIERVGQETYAGIKEFLRTIITC